jgi:TonB-dependent SusC/RagA subfamily outer membrane receptor
MLKYTLFLFLFLTAGLVNAQDMFQEYLYSADLVMKNRENISLSDAQADKIKKIHSTNAADFSTLKWDLDAATEKLKKLLAEAKPNAVAVSKQLDIVLNLENQLKKKQLSTLVAIKNELTESQQASLNSSRSWTVYGSTAKISPTPLSTSPRIRVASGPKVTQGFANKSTEKGTTTSIIEPSGDNLLILDSKSKFFFQLEQTLNGDKPTYYLKTKSGLKEIFSFEEISPDDIESISVIKGASAIELYGDKGKNGVIIITLK